MLRNPLPLFALVTLTAPALVAAGAVWGGTWSLAGLVWMTVLTASLDALVTRTLPRCEGSEFPAANALSVALALAHFALWGLVIAAAGGATGLVTWENWRF